MEPTKTIQETEADIIENFSMFDQWLDKYEYLIDLGTISSASGSQTRICL